MNKLYKSVKWTILDVNYKEKNGYTRLMIACINDNINFVKELVENGADINAVNYQNNTALMLSMIRGHYDIMVYLISVESNINIMNKRGLTPFTYSIDCAYYIGLLNTTDRPNRSLFIDLVINGPCKPDVFTKNQFGHNALYFAHKRKNHSVELYIKEIMLESISTIFEKNISHDIMEHIVMNYI
jgi:ankyrin repeat protein